MRNSVNFPETALPRRQSGVLRLCIVNQNVSGVLGKITTLLGDQSLNILQTVNTSRGDIAYNVVDIDQMPDDVDALFESLTAIEGLISARILDGKAGRNYRTVWSGL